MSNLTLRFFQNRNTKTLNLLTDLLMCPIRRFAALIKGVIMPFCHSSAMQCVQNCSLIALEKFFHWHSLYVWLLHLSKVKKNPIFPTKMQWTFVSFCKLHETSSNDYMRHLIHDNTHCMAPYSIAMNQLECWNASNGSNIDMNAPFSSLGVTIFYII